MGKGLRWKRPQGVGVGQVQDCGVAPKVEEVEGRGKVHRGEE